MQAQYTDVTM